MILDKRLACILGLNEALCKCQLKNVQFLESQNVQLLELIITAFFAF